MVRKESRRVRVKQLAGKLYDLFVSEDYKVVEEASAKALVARGKLKYREFGFVQAVDLGWTFTMKLRDALIEVLGYA